MNDDEKKKDDRTIWPVAGGLLLGIGAGLFFIQQNPMALVGCLLAGLGIGLIISAILHVKVDN